MPAVAPLTPMKFMATLLIVSFSLAGTGSAFAQASNCTPTQADPQQGSLSPDSAASGRNAEPLSDRLARSDGVLCPPGGVDSEMRVPAPNTGTTPVIPPPGSSNVDPNVRPK
jgi:hypothetical protein